MKKLFILFFISFSLIQNSFAQEFSAGADILNLYMWRGLDLGGGQPSIQPWVKYTFGTEKHEFSVGYWSAFAIGGNVNQEVDLSVNYTFNGLLTFNVTDYFFPGLNTGTKNDYFEYRSDHTGHVIEGQVMFNGTEKIPVTLLFTMNFYGNDAKKADGALFFSKYVEAGYKAHVKGLDVTPFAGFCLDKADTENGEFTYYQYEKPGLINLGLKLSKSVEITDKFSLPIQCAVVTNPALNKIHMVFGISLGI